MGHIHIVGLMEKKTFEPRPGGGQGVSGGESGEEQARKRNRRCTGPQTMVGSLFGNSR